MAEKTLVFPAGYDPSTQTLLGTWAAQLDEQLTVLRGVTEGLGTEELEWQSAPGHNTIGMLLAHLAIVEIWWLKAAAAELDREEGDAITLEILGIRLDDDGIPLPPEGGHPPALTGWTRKQYFDVIERGRTELHAVLRSWHDDDLSQTFRLKEHTISRAWTVYHLLEHFACHLGQIRMLRRALADHDQIAPKPILF